MPIRGQSAWGGPVYSDDDPVDFLHQWLRMSWVQTLCGRRFDQTGDTFGWDLCAVRSLKLLAVDVCPAVSTIRLKGEVQIEVEAHSCDDDSRLKPDAVFDTFHRDCIMLIQADLHRNDGMFEVIRFEVSPTTKGMLAAAARWGGPSDPYVWVAPDEKRAGASRHGVKNLWEICCQWFRRISRRRC